MSESGNHPDRPGNDPDRPGTSRDRLGRRLAQLYGGLVLYGVSMALMIESTLGLNAWNVLHQGLAKLTGLSIGTITFAVGALILLLWIPLRQRPGLGTVSNILVIGPAMDATLAMLPTVRPLAAQIGFLTAGIVLNAVAIGLYIGARLGPGPRDGLMTGYIARRPGRSIRLVRTVIEVTVLAVGWASGGTVGIGTIAYVLAIGPLVHVLLPALTVPATSEAATGCGYGRQEDDVDGEPPPRRSRLTRINPEPAPSANVPNTEVIADAGQ